MEIILLIMNCCFELFKCEYDFLSSFKRLSELREKLLYKNLNYLAQKMRFSYSAED